VEQAVERLGAVAVFVAADRDAMISEFETTLKPTVRYRPFSDVCPTIFLTDFFAAADPELWNSLPSHLKYYDLIIQSVPAVTEDIFVWIVGPWWSVNYFICAD